MQKIEQETLDILPVFEGCDHRSARRMLSKEEKVQRLELEYQAEVEAGEVGKPQE